MTEDSSAPEYEGKHILVPNQNEAFTQDAEYWQSLVDDIATDLHESFPPGADVTPLLKQINDLRDMGIKVLARAALDNASVTIGDVTVELYVDDDGNPYLAVADQDMDKITISGGRAGGVVEGKRLIYGAN